MKKILILLGFLVILVGCEKQTQESVFDEQEVKQSIKEEIEEIENKINLEKGPLFAEIENDTLGNKKNGKYQKLCTVFSEDNKRKDLFSFQVASFDVRVVYFNGSLYFSNDDKNIEVVNMKTGESSVLGIEDVADFIIYDSNLFYLKGECSFGSSCSLGLYDISNSKNKIILYDLNKKISTQFCFFFLCK